MRPTRRFVDAALTRLTDRRLADSILGDLNEERHRRAARSRISAALWATHATTAVLAYALLTRLRDVVRELPGTLVSLARLPSGIASATRALRRTPWYAATTIGVIALGMMLATTVFAVVHSVLLRTLPYERAHELHLLSAGYSEEVLSRPGVSVLNRSGLGLSWMDVADIRAAAPDARITALRGASGEPPLGSLGPTLPARARIDPWFFETLGLSPAIGGFSSEDFVATSARVIPAIISHGLWQREFGGRRDIVGQSYAPAGDGNAPLYRVAGVLPAGFEFPSNERQPDILAPLVVTAGQLDDRRARQWQFIVRLPDTVPIDQYQTLFNEIAMRAARSLGDTKENGGAGPTDRFALEPVSSFLGRRARETSQQVLGVALLLVLLACINVSGLATMRSVDRVRELALRRALGARTSDIAVTVLAESAVLVGTGTLIGLALANPLAFVVLRIMPASLRVSAAPPIQATVLAFAALAAVITTAIVAAGAIWRARQSPAGLVPNDLERASPRTRSIGRFAVVTTQVALGVLLTLCGTFVVGSMLRASWADLGFATDRVVMISGSIPMPGPGGAGPAAANASPLSGSAAAAARALALEDLLDELRSLPGVSAAGATSAPLLGGGSPGGMFLGDTYSITDGFVEVVQPRLLEGRWPTSEELATGADVIVITPDAAARSFPGRAPLGELVPGGQGPTKVTMRVIGIVAPARFGSWDWTAGLWLQSYVPYRHTALQPNFTAVVRTAQEDALLTWAARRARDRSSPIRLATAARANDLLDVTMAPRSFQSWVFGAFTLAALIIVGAGVLGLVAMASTRRRREIGVRMALGATRRGIVRLIVREQVPAVVSGLLVGGLAGLGAARLIEAYVYGLTPNDPRVIWTMTTLVVLAVSLVGVAIPAVRASKADPMEALRVE